VQALLPALDRLSQDKGWRVRKALVQYIPSISRHFGQEFYESFLAHYMSLLLGDHYYAVREAAIEALKRLVQVFGSEWALNALFSVSASGTIKRLCSNSNYLFRETALMAIERIMPLIDDPMAKERLVTLVLGLLGDRIPNVRLVACKTLEKIALDLPKNPFDEIQAELNKLTVRDEDEDVKRYASQALKAINN
jgi:serine/threonine-protein phosphatase 2A regulatory subunit A